VPVDPRTELTRRLEAAPVEHAEALLVAWDVLQAAHDQGALDIVHGALAGRDTIFGKLAEYAKLPESVNGIRNVISLMKVVGSIEPERLEQLAKAMAAANEEHAREDKPPSAWQLFRRATNEDGRRGLSFVVQMLSALGRGVK
jgi:uncharacterized protein YjgD (DUF1641 family)